jgi:hypothetical protein
MNWRKMASFKMLGSFIVGAAMLQGCGGGEPGAEVSQTKSEESTVTVAKGDGGEVRIEQKGDEAVSISVKSEEGNAQFSSGEAVQIPKDFPADVPIYPGMKVQFVQSVTENATFNLQGQTPDALEKVTENLKAKVTAQGWTEKLSMNQAGEGGQAGAFLNYEKEGRSLNLVLTGQEDGTVINVVTAKN